MRCDVTVASSYPFRAGCCLSYSFVISVVAFSALGGKGVVRSFHQWRAEMQWGNKKRHLGFFDRCERKEPPLSFRVAAMSTAAIFFESLLSYAFNPSSFDTGRCYLFLFLPKVFVFVFVHRSVELFMRVRTSKRQRAKAQKEIYTLSGPVTRFAELNPAGLWDGR